ncbi:MAG: hypothetical protein PG981_000087 [Wolbachia endosymbiont of Ctenocephalides orientis wCori]|nr:MAG: hypothetical protein PG981_000087 [Wolbachia endosymbiont of Ctenocephalides orientis wCori]
MPTTTSQDQQDNDNLTEDQQELYNNLKSAIKGDYIVKLSSLLQSLSKEDLGRVLTVKQEVTSDAMTGTLTLLGYALTFNDGGKRIKAILENIFIIDNQDILKEIFTAEQKVTYKDDIQETLSLLGYAMSFYDSDEKIKVILEHVSPYPILLKEILTAKQIVDGEEFTLLQFANHYAPECVTIIREKMKEAGLSIDQHTSQITLFDRHKGKAACGLGLAGVALVAFSFIVLSGFGAAAAFILGILALASAMAIAGKMVSEKAEKDGVSKCDAVRSIISDIFSISGKENKQEV